MAVNPISSLMPKDPNSTPIGTELNERAKMQQAGVDALKPTAAPKGTAMRPVGASPVDKVAPKAKFGDRPGEKRINTDEMTKPLGQMHSGGTVPKTGPYVLKEGEKVLTQGQHNHLKNAMGLAHDALSGPEHDNKPAKIVKEMHIRKTDNGGYIAKHIHTSFEHPDEEHVHPHTDALHDHIEAHWGEPNDGEEESESQKDTSPGVTAIQKAVGMEK